MTKILITVDKWADLNVYSDCPNVEVVVAQDRYLYKYEFSNGVGTDDFAATQHKVW